MSEVIQSPSHTIAGHESIKLRAMSIISSVVHSAGVDCSVSNPEQKSPNPWLV